MSNLPAIGGKRMAIRPRKMSLEHIMMCGDVIGARGECRRVGKKAV